MFERFEPQPGCAPVSDAAADWKQATRTGQYRLGDRAVFWPDGRYVPRTEITQAAVTTKTIATRGCCGMTLPNPAVSFFAGGKKYLLLADSKKQAEQLAAALGGGNGAEKGPEKRGRTP